MIPGLSPEFARIQVVFLLIDGLLLYLSAYVGYLIRFSGQVWENIGEVQSQAFTFTIVMLYMFYLADMYSSAGRPSLARRLNFVFLFGLIPLSMVGWALPSLAMGRGWFLVSYAVAMLTLLLWRRWAERLFEKFRPRERVLVVGTGPSALDARDLLERTSASHYEIAGFVPVPGNRLLVPKELTLPPETDISEFARKERIQRIVVATDDRRGAFPIPELLNCKMAGIDVLDVPTLMEMFEGKISLNVHSSALIFAPGFRRSRLARMLKTSIDRMLAVVGLIIASPFFAVLPILIKLDSPGPIFFRQLRVGEHGRNFEIKKFRTMRQDAEADGPKWASVNDSRITRFGSFLRKSRLDELPQLLNVLEGSMSFVGPRPEVPGFVEKLRHTLPYYDQRHVVKPGITGWAQVKYRYGASAEDAGEKLQYDLYYIKHFSILLDSLIIFETIRSVLLARGSR